LRGEELTCREFIRAAITRALRLQSVDCNATCGMRLTAATALHGARGLAEEIPLHAVSLSDGDEHLQAAAIRLRSLSSGVLR